MRVMITGSDGYLGWPLVQYLYAQGHEVGGIDNYSRRSLVKRVGSTTAIPIDQRCFDPLAFFEGDLRHVDDTKRIYREFKPDAIVYLGEIPSAPYSMMGFEEAAETQYNNVIGTLATLYAMKEVCPAAHLIKLGTMGEYGTPDVNIPEGFFDLEYRGRKDRVMFPRKAGSWYHQSKVHDTHNTEMACRIWGLRSTDIMQGVVYGTQIDEMRGEPQLATRFDFDECFGTAINRFCAQAVIGMPLTVYGSGMQQRGFLSLRDSVQCLSLAVGNPPSPGEYRVFNQFDQVYSIHTLAKWVEQVGNKLDLNVTHEHIANPRIEQQEHFYAPDHQHLHDLGYRPSQDLDAELEIMLGDLLPHRERIKRHKHCLVPAIAWK